MAQEQNDRHKFFQHADLGAKVVAECRCIVGKGICHELGELVHVVANIECADGKLSVHRFGSLGGGLFRSPGKPLPHRNAGDKSTGKKGDFSGKRNVVPKHQREGRRKNEEQDRNTEEGIFGFHDKVSYLI